MWWLCYYDIIVLDLSTLFSVTCDHDMCDHPVTNIIFSSYLYNITLISNLSYKIDVKINKNKNEKEKKRLSLQSSTLT